MIRVNILVEGQTEETFVRELLGSYLGEQSIFVRARSVVTSRRKGIIHKGGLSKYEKFKNDLYKWMKEDQNALYTSMLDFYALPEDFPGLDNVLSMSDPFSRVEHIERELARDIDSRCFIPYIQLHEFEALLLSNPEMFDKFFIGKSDAISRLAELCNKFPSPEHINLGRETSPSKSIIHFIPDYKGAKTAASPIIAKHIGLETMRSKCIHFSQWLDRLIALRE